MSVEAAPIVREPWSHRASNRMWPKATQVTLLAIGVLLALMTFAVVMTMPDLPFHAARDAELRATYDAYRSTGVLLVKQNGTGSWYGQVPGHGFTRAAGDDDPGIYIVASLMSHVTGSASPYPGLRLAMALALSLPLLLLPLAIARVFRRARAGYAMLVLPGVIWLVNHGTILIGTEYGLSDSASPTRVYALYGFASALVFGALVVITHLSTFRLRWASLIAWTGALALFAGACNLTRSLSGVGVALGIAVLWWVRLDGQRPVMRVGATVLAGAVLAAGSLAVSGLVMGQIDAARAKVVSPQASQLPAAHGTWHPIYLGLSYPEPMNGNPTLPSKFGIVWSDEFGWAKARAIDPNVRIASAKYDSIMKHLYLDIVKAHPFAVARLYLDKTLFTVKYFAAIIVVILVGFGLVWRRPGVHRSRARRVAAIVLPTILFGMLPPVLVMPFLYYFVELSAGLGLMTALAVGGLFWAYSSLPSYVRAAERRRITERGIVNPSGGTRELSFIVPTRNGAATIGQTLEAIGARLGSGDEIIVVENGSTDATRTILTGIREAWDHEAELVVTTSPPGLGHALRTGVLASEGRRLLLSADDLPFGFSDLEGFRNLPGDVVVAIGSKAHPASVVNRSSRRTAQSRLFRVLREALLHSAVGDSQGTFWIDGAWGRTFASMSRETGLMWTVELVLAAEQQGLRVWEVPVVLSETHDRAPSRFTLRDSRIAVREIVRLALQKDDFAEDEWVPALRSSVSV